ncbi:MAG: hypothetical protein HYT27_03710 [Parcubacteria group bacterium]|nr:hypothetical protein [Parcubacteria group bacterium]
MNTTKLQNEINDKLLKEILSDRKILVAATRKSLLYFFYVYFGSYIRCAIAPFHCKMFQIAENDSLKRAGIIAFRGSAKSTILNTAYALWAVMGRQQKKHIVIASQTQQRARDHLKNIRKEIEKNQLLRQNLGPFEETEDQWRASALVVPRYEARITAISVEEGIRGLREGPHRPDLIIADDIEDSASVKTKEGRDKTFDWLTGELLPIGDINTKVLFIGNFLHEDAALMRICNIIKEGKMRGELLRVPIIGEEEVIAWPGMFSTMEAVEELRQNIGNEVVWQREYLLKYVPEANQIIKPEDIHYYDSKPKVNYVEDGKTITVEPYIKCTGVDLAIGQNESNDFTAMVSGEVIYINSNSKLYILPEPFKDRVNFHQAIQYAISIHKASNGYHHFFVENVAYQKAAIEELTKNNLYVTPMQALQDRRSRYQVAAIYIKTGAVLFPESGCEELLQQLFYFGSESHDDLLDALVYLILGVMHTGTVNRGEIRSL